MDRREEWLFRKRPLFLLEQELFRVDLEQSVCKIKCVCQYAMKGLLGTDRESKALFLPQREHMRKDVNILVAEGNPEHFDLIRTHLLEAGVHNEILHFADGRLLLDFVFNPDTGPESQCRPRESIVLTELNLPTIDGLQILEKIKQDEQLKKMPVIILTATDDQDTIDRCFSLNCSTYIVKPADPQEFEETIESFGRFLSVVETLI